MTLSGRQRGFDLEDPTTERDSERIAAEYIHHMHDHKQDGSLPPLWGAAQVGLAKHHHPSYAVKAFLCHAGKG
jgi:hypothetical protein